MNTNLIEILDHMVDTQLNNFITKNVFFSILYVVFTQFSLYSQNYPDTKKVYRSYYQEQYESYLPIKDCILIIDHEQLLQSLQKHEKALVYTFANGCSANKLLSLYENWCKENGYKLFLVMVYISSYEKTTEQNPSSQLFVINDEIYPKKTSDRFKNGLKGLPLNTKSKYEGGLLFFENGKYVKTLRELP